MIVKLINKSNDIWQWDVITKTFIRPASSKKIPLPEIYWIISIQIIEVLYSHQIVKHTLIYRSTYTKVCEGPFHRQCTNSYFVIQLKLKNKVCDGLFSQGDMKWIRRSTRRTWTVLCLNSIWDKQCPNSTACIVGNDSNTNPMALHHYEILKMHSIMGVTYTK